MKFHYQVTLEIHPPPECTEDELLKIYEQAKVTLRAAGKMMIGVSACQVERTDFAVERNISRFFDPPKSARGWLKPVGDLGSATPLHLVVSAALLVLIGWLLGTTMKP